MHKLQLCDTLVTDGTEEEAKLYIVLYTVLKGQPKIQIGILISKFVIGV